MSLTLQRAHRLGGVAGILFVVLAAVALALPGSPPKADEVGEIGTFLADKRDEILASNYVLGVAFVFYLLFVGALRSRLAATDRDGLRSGSTMLAGAATTTAMILAGAAVLSGAVFQVGAAGDVNLNHALYDVSSDLFVASGFGLAAFFVGAAVAIASSGALPSWLAPAALAVALLNLVAPVAFFADSGFFAIGGAYGFIVPIASLLWVLVVSVVMVRGPAPAGQAPGTRAATPAA
jgi:hypothetical protein